MQGAVNNEQYPELIEMLLSGDIRTFRERLQSFIDQLPDNKRSANKKGFFSLFMLGGFLTLPDTKLGRDLGVKQVYYHIEKDKTGYISGVKFAIPIEKQNNKKLLFVVVSDDVHIEFTPEEISYIKSKLGSKYDRLDKVGYSIPIEHLRSTEYQSNVKIREIKGINRRSFMPQRFAIHGVNALFFLKERTEVENLEDLISKSSLPDVKEVQGSIKKVFDYFDSVVQENIIKKSGHFKLESDYHGLFAGFFVMLFKYRYNLKSYLELSLGEGFSDIVVLVRSPERSDNAIPIIIELKAGKTLTIQGTPFDQAEKYAEAFKYGPQRMITNNDNVIYAVYNPDLPNNRIKIDKAARDKQHPKPFLQSVLESADPAQIREQLKYTYYSIPNLAENYYRYTSEVLLGELIPVRTTREVWNKYIFQHDRGVSNDITSFGFVNSGKNELVLLNIIRSDSRSKKINIDEVIGKNEEVNVKLGMHESIRGNRNLKIREVNLLLETKKARAGEFKNWCRKVQVNSCDNLDNYNIKKTQSFSGEFAKLDIDVNKLKNMLDNAVDKKGIGTQSDNAEHYKKLFTEVSSTVFPIKEMINNEIDFQAILHGLFMYYSDSQMSGGSKKRIGVIPEVQSGRGKRIDIGVIGGEEFTGIELKFSETQGIADGLTTKAKEAESQLDRYKKQPNNVKSLTDSERAKMFWAVFHKGASTPESLIETRDKFDVFLVSHSSMHILPPLQPEDILEQSRDIFNQQCNGNRKKRNINMACVDSRDEEKITEEEKKQLIRELFNTDKVVEKVKNIEFYDQLFKVSQKISKGEIIDKNVEEAFVAKIKDIDLDSIDPEIRGIVKEMNDNIENKEEVKNILRRSGVAEKIGKVAEGAGLAFTAFLVGKHIANGDIEGLGYDALNLWVMPKIGEKISEKMLELGTKLDSQMLKGFAPVMGRAIGNFAAFLGLAESIKARQNATDPADIKIADLNIATNSIFIAADVPAVVTETMSAIGMEAGIIGEFAGPVGAAISVAVIIIAQFVEAGLEVEKLGEHIKLTDQEKHDLYWDFFLGKKVPDYIGNDLQAEEIYKQYISKILNQFKSNYDTIAISLPSILVTKEEYATSKHFRDKRQGHMMPSDVGKGIVELLGGFKCSTQTRVISNRLGFDLGTNITHFLYADDMNYYSRIVPSTIENYSVTCGPRDDDITIHEKNREILYTLPSQASCGDSSPHRGRILNRVLEKWSLQEHSGDCYNAVIYRNKNSRGYGSIYYIPAQNANVNIVFQEKDILNGDRDRRDNIENRYYFEKSLDSCKVYSPGKNFFHIAGKFSCDLGADGQKNIVITQGNLTTDSINIHSIIGSNRTNYLEFFNVDYVDGKGGNDVITAKNFTTIKGYFGDSIHGKGLVLLPINFNDIYNITHVNNITTIYNKSGASISVDKQTSVKTADGLFVTPTKIDDKTGVVTNLHVIKSLRGDIVLDDELDNLRKIDNSSFNITKQLSSANYHSTIGGSSNHIFYPDKEHHNFYWEAPSNISHLYLFENRDANITIAQANGILDFSQLNCTLDDIPFIENNKGEIKINRNSLHVALLPNYKDVTVTFDGQEYYKLQNGELERDYCSHSLKIDGRFSVNGTDLLNHHNCFTFDSDKVLFLKLNNDLLLLSDKGALSISNYYSSVHKNWDLSVELNNRIIEPEEFGERADEFSSFRYYKPDEQGLQIYHNQPINKNDIGLVDLKDKSILDFDMKVMNDSLLLLREGDVLVKVENWNTYQPAREMIFAFNDTIISNPRRIVSTFYKSEGIIEEFNREKSTLLLKEQLFSSIELGSFDMTNLMINEGADIEAKDNKGRTPVLFAIYLGKWHIVHLLINKGANIDAKDNIGRTPLHWAARNGHLSIVQHLIEKGANLSIKDNDGKTPLDLARDKGHNNVVEYLQQTQLGLDRQLLTAVQGGNLNEVKDFVVRGASLDTQDSNNGWTPIIYAARGSKWDAVKFLIAQGAKFNNEITYQGTPLHFAAQEGNSNMVQFLLDKGANIEAQDAYNRKPLHIAVDANRLNVVNLLLDRGANLKATEMYGKTSLDLAIQKGYEDIVEVLKQKQLDLDKELLISTEKGDLEKVRDGIRQGVNVNVQGRQGWTPVFWAIQKNNFNIVELLLDNNADIKVKDDEGWTPIHWAVQLGSLDVVKRLVERGADVNALTADGRTPYDLAINQNYREIKEYLRSKSAVPSSALIYHVIPADDSVRQRKRRHHHGDHARHHMSRKLLAIDSSNQPEIAVSGSTRPSSWINDLFGWVKSSIGGLLSSKPVGISSTKDSISQVDGQFAKASVSNSSSTSTTLSSDGTDKKQESNYFTNGGFSRDNIGYVNANIKQMRERQTPVKFKPSGGNTILEMGDHYLSQVDFNGTIILLDLLIRKVTRQKYISTVDQSISPLEAQGYALNITEGFEKVVEQAGLKSGVSMHRLNIDFVEIQKEVTGKIMSGKFDEISGVLNSYLEEACPGREAGCPGKLSPKKFDKFIAQFNKGLLNQSIEQILHNRDGRLEVDGTKKQQMSLEPQSYLSNASVHSHSKDKISTCLSDVGVTKLGNTLSK
ncbi:ankyrin repeat domain-containing protein [Wolbachia endosymbiont (group B) of Ischnura elegans]|uniref:ankyrin repeat domain-containing protein n=1 Tax=Wolbachia endosymbiont (group B) of Ischnura elegans TaxID=2954021 RepID=UPI00222EB721|nr:ankyrin repeat domain-containing protein [Wolbachia endosymbiont (group B) of Ischnura elegans]